MWKNFFGTIGARRRVSSSSDALAGLVRPAALEVLAHRRDVEHGDLVAVEDADAPVLAERDELHSRPLAFSHAMTSTAFRSGGNTG